MSIATSTVGDIEISYNASGSTNQVPVVFVHGLAEDKSSWQAIQRDLGDRRTFAYDLRGHGTTTIGDAEGTLEQLGADLVGFVENVSGPAVVVGFSLGGTITLWAAAQRPDLVTHAVVLGTSSVVGRGAITFYEQRIAEAADTGTALFRAAIRDDTAAALCSARNRTEEVTAARLRAIGDGSGYINAARAMAAMRQNPLTPALTDITAHVDVVGAVGDTFCPRKASDIIVESLRDVTYHEIADAGHLMNVDNPAAVSQTLQNILGRN